MRFLVLALLIAGPAAAQTGSPMPDDVPTLTSLESLYAAAAEARAQAPIAALTPASVLADAWTDVIESATVLNWSFRALTDTTPVPGMSAAEMRVERRDGLAAIAPLAAAVAAGLSVAAPLRLALTPPAERDAVYARIGRDADALRLLLDNTGYEASAAAVGSDAEVDAALAAFAPRAALVAELVGRLRAATPGAGGQ